MPVMDGVATTQELKNHYPEIKILILTTFDDDEYISQAMNYGAKGYLLKDSPPEDLAMAIRVINKNHTYMGSGLLEKMLQHTPQPEDMNIAISQQLADLSPREKEVLNLIATGANNREIAKKLYISEKTVKNHITSILSKLNLRDRTQAALLVNQVQNKQKSKL
jgi:DNA-binding NarL/FixJ family response regulator